ncbi:MAG: hypothetical protein ACRET3_14370 [Burkholderiales bacterium]
MYTRSSLLAAVLFAPLLLYAQDSTSRSEATPFRRGQWAAQFQAGISFGSLGFIKFRSPTRALVLDLRVNGGHSETLRSDSSGANQFSSLSSAANLQARFGWRHFAGNGNEAKVVAHYTLGALAGFNHSVSAGFGESSEANGWTAGVFGDIGGTYLLTPKFGIGALASATLSYENAVAKSSSGTKSRRWFLGGSAGIASLVATVFF